MTPQVIIDVNELPVKIMVKHKMLKMPSKWSWQYEHDPSSPNFHWQIQWNLLGTSKGQADSPLKPKSLLQRKRLRTWSATSTKETKVMLSLAHPC